MDKYEYLDLSPPQAVRFKYIDGEYDGIAISRSDAGMVRVEWVGGETAVPSDRVTWLTPEVQDDYQEFINGKTISAQPVGFDVDPNELPKCLMDFQRTIVQRAIRIGRVGIFANTGLGKTVMSLSWADAILKHEGDGAKCLIFAPLAVASQTVEEGAKFGFTVNLCESQDDLQPGINITNYEKLHRFSPEGLTAIVLDESSIIKHHDSKSFDLLTEFAHTIKYRACFTATPAPNDYEEFGCHAEFLGVMGRREMLSTFFKYDSGECAWRLRGWGEERFWQWLPSWSVVIRKPSDFGYEDRGFNLPPLHDHHHIVEGKLQPKEGELLASVRGMSDRRRARKASLEERCQLAADLVNNSSEPWLVWCELNDEGELLKRLIPDAVQVKGSDKPQQKVDCMMAFTHSEVRVLVSKPSICGFGMNWQHCRNVLFVGLNDSYESFYQATNRCYRFGQPAEMHRHLIYSDQEAVVWDNLQRKKAQADQMWNSARNYAAAFSDLHKITTSYNPQIELELPQWLLTA